MNGKETPGDKWAAGNNIIWPIYNIAGVFPRFSFSERERTERKGTGNRFTKQIVSKRKKDLLGGESVSCSFSLGHIYYLGHHGCHNSLRHFSVNKETKWRKNSAVIVKTQIICPSFPSALSSLLLSGSLSLGIFAMRLSFDSKGKERDPEIEKVLKEKLGHMCPSHRNKEETPRKEIGQRPGKKSHRRLNNESDGGRQPFLSHFPFLGSPFPLSFPVYFTFWRILFEQKKRPKQNKKDK